MICPIRKTDCVRRFRSWYCIFCNKKVNKNGNIIKTKMEEKMRKLIIALVFFGMCSIAQAEEVKIGSWLEKFPVKEGFFYSVEDGQGSNVLGVEVFKKYGFSINAAYFGLEGAGGTLDYDLSNLPIENVPVMKFLEYLSVGYGAGVQKITLPELQDNPDSDNRFVHGPVLYAKIKF